MHILRVFLIVLFAPLAFLSISSFASAEKLITQDLQDGNHFIILRHALAPGTGDPENFALDNCATQRNLSGEGRDQAQRIGDFLRENGIDAARVYTSQWCRCVDTAKLLGIGEVRDLPVLNSFFRSFEKKERQTDELRDWLVDQDFSTPLVLVSHQVNITALTGIFPRSGEMVVVERKEDSRFQVTGTYFVN